MQVRVDGDDAIDAPGDQRTDDLLADRFPLVERSVLPHVAEIGSQQYQALRATAPQRLDGKQQCDQFFVRTIEWHIDNGRRCRGSGRHPDFPIGKPVNIDLVKGDAKPRCEPGSVARRGRQALNHGLVHVTVSLTGCLVPMVYPELPLAAVAARSSSDRL